MVSATVMVGDNMTLFGDLHDESALAVLTDPPYGIGYMGEAWDDPRKGHDNTLHPGKRFQIWSQDWMTQCYRVLKPGKQIACFAAARQVHRVVAAMIDAGFCDVHVRGWIYLTGNPKFLDLFTQAQQAQVESDLSLLQTYRHTALKPAWEPVVIGTKKP